MRAIGFHWHAVQREILGLGRRVADMFTPQLAAAEVVAVVLAPDTTSALFYEMSRGFSLTEHLRRPTRPAKPPDINDPDNPVQHIAPDVMTIEQFENRMRRLTDGPKPR